MEFQSVKLVQHIQVIIPYDTILVSSVTVNVAGDGSQPNLQAKTGINPSTSSQTIEPDNGYDGLSSVQINAMPSGTAGTPSATKGTVSNHSISLTPSVTNTTGYITGGSLTGESVTVSPSELVSGTYSVKSSGTKDVTNYASAYVPSRSVGFPTATKGVVTNHTISIEPEVETTGGYTTVGLIGVTPVTVSESELVSGNKEITSNGTNIDVTNYATASVAVPATTPNLQAKTGITPTESSQTIEVDSTYDGLSSV